MSTNKFIAYLFSYVLVPSIVVWASLMLISLWVSKDPVSRVLFGVVFLSLGLLLGSAAMNALKNRFECPECKKWGGVKVISTKESSIGGGSYEDLYGEYTTPVSRVQITEYQCKNCGHEWQRTEKT